MMWKRYTINSGAIDILTSSFDDSYAPGHPMNGFCCLNARAVIAAATKTAAASRPAEIPSKVSFKTFAKLSHAWSTKCLPTSAKHENNLSLFNQMFV